MENTVENKEQFMTQYWNQPVLKFVNNPDKLKVMDWFKLKNGWLELKSIESISEEDAKEIGCEGASIDEYGFTFSRNATHYWTSAEADYLRSKGYAIPWMDIPVKTLIEYGWVKLVDNQ